MNPLVILASADVSGLIALYREIGTTLIGVGFVCAGLAVLKNHERTKEAIITYLVALITWLLIWQLI